MSDWRPKGRPITNADDLETLHGVIRPLISSDECEPLPHDVQARLHTAAIRGHQRARERLWMSWLRYTFEACTHFIGGAPLEELWQEAQIGLWEAIDTWDPDGGRALGVWAMLSIRRRCHSAIREARGGYRAPTALNGDDDLPEAVPVPEDHHDDAPGVRPDIDWEAQESVRTILGEVLDGEELEVVMRYTGIDGDRGVPFVIVAEELGVSEDVANKAYHRALAKLRDSAYMEDLLALWEEL